MALLNNINAQLFLTWQGSVTGNEKLSKYVLYKKEFCLERYFIYSLIPMLVY